MSMSTILESVATSPIPEEPLYEVVGGQRVELSPMGAYPTRIASILGQFLGQFARTQKLGRVDVEMLYRIDPATNLQRRPDVAFVSYDRWPRETPVPETAAWDVVPDLAIEVVSPTDRADDLMDKIHGFFQAGTRQVWVVYPRLRLVHVYESFTRIRVVARSETLDGGALLPGFQLPLTTLFEDEPEGPTR